MKNKQNKKSVAIVGAGFGGISVARKLAKSSDLEIHIIDRRNHHLFQPLLYQVAMAGLNPSEISVPIRRLFRRNSNVRVVLAEVDNIDINSSTVSYDDIKAKFDYIVIACGAKHFYFGKNDWEVLAPGLKNIEQATEIRRRILTAFEFAEKEKDLEKQKSYLTFSVIGGGPTGVEIAGAIAEMAKTTLVDDYRVADLTQTKVYLIEAGSRVLPSFPEKLSRRAEHDLKSLGVTVIKNTRASDLSSTGLQAGANWISCKTIIWAAGVKPASIAESTDTKKDEQGRLVVCEDLSLPSNKNIFAIGDVAVFYKEDGTSLPGIAPVAIQQGQFVGKQILNEVKGRPRGVFRYWDKGIMATIGRSKAVVCSGNLQITGFAAWLTWVFIHIIYLMRFKNRVFVFFQWVWAYFSFGHGARLIVHKTWRFYSGKKITYGSETESSET
ncbi:MAG: NAD(P)/FAD-dependent oxidoreductase [Bdellovibrionales bacterium]|nr:NAD(P)/FAD-dependent oxidoreductase [Bdellovibrionales bacterium]